MAACCCRLCFLYRRGFEAEGIEPLAAATRSAHRAEFGDEPGLPAAPVTSMWRDITPFNEAGIPSLTYGPSSSTGGGNFSVNTNYTIPGVLPAGYQPTQDARPGAGGTTYQNSSLAWIQPSGQLRLRTGNTAHSEIWIDGVSWFVD